MSEQEAKRASGDSPEKEHTYHHYKGNRIPSFIHLMWLAFWIMAVIYGLSWVFPNMQLELVSPP